MLEDFVHEIVQKGQLPPSYRDWCTLSGGTNSQVARITSPNHTTAYVLKVNTAEQVEAETTFYALYRDIALFPNVYAVDYQHRYFLYEYIEGRTGGGGVRKDKLMRTLVDDVVCRYVPPETPDLFPWIEDPRVVLEDIQHAEGIIGTHLPAEDHALVRALHVQRCERVAEERRYVLHGDFGVHNVLVGEGRVSGVIDPIPCLGRPIYDILYAFCSSPDDLEPSILLPVVERLTEQLPATAPICRRHLLDDTLISLYLRICTCLYHHPHDLPLYLNAWRRWVNLAFECPR